MRPTGCGWASLCMEGRHVFEHLTVAENLIAGAYFRGRVDIEAELDTVYRLLPACRPPQPGGGLPFRRRAADARHRPGADGLPRLLMLDEPSLGLAPLLVKEIFAFIAQINEEMGLTVLVVEQNARRALEIAHHGYIMEQGRIVLEGTAAELADNPDVGSSTSAWATPARGRASAT